MNIHHRGTEEMGKDKLEFSAFLGASVVKSNSPAA
jgi:hypothetical protein